VPILTKKLILHDYLCMNNVIDHDRLFKELIATFFVEFIQLFFP